jgi:hypothetical protein
MEDPHNLVAIHRELRQGPRRRTREVALNRAIVMFSVGAWQAYVQDVVTTAYDLLAPPAGQPQGWYLVNLFCHDLPDALSRPAGVGMSSSGPVGSGRGAMADAAADYEATNGSRSNIWHTAVATAASNAAPMASSGSVGTMTTALRFPPRSLSAKLL